MSRALTFPTDPSRWDDAYEDLSFTGFALATQADDPAIAPLYTEVRAVLADWERIETDRKSGRGAAIGARAQARVADAALDLAIAKLAKAVLEHTGGARDHALYWRLFPVAHERVIALGLDGELPSASLVMAELDAAKEEGDDGPLADLAAHAEPLRQCLMIGNAALTARAHAFAELGRIEARVEAWLETADAVTRGVAHELSVLTEIRGLDTRWTKSFFAA
jgi:hypothetical protein